MNLSVFLKPKFQLVLMVIVTIVAGFAITTLIADDTAGEEETRLLEAISEKVDTRLTSIDSEQRRQDQTKMAADEIERIASSIPNLPESTVAALRMIALSYVDPITEVMNNAEKERMEIETQTEEDLLNVPEGEDKIKAEISLKSTEKVGEVRQRQDQQMKELSAKKNNEFAAAIPDDYKEAFQKYLNPDQQSEQQ